jgi:hypothetical protein
MKKRKVNLAESLCIVIKKIILTFFTTSSDYRYPTVTLRLHYRLVNTSSLAFVLTMLNISQRNYKTVIQPTLLRNP